MNKTTGLGELLLYALQGLLTRSLWNVASCAYTAAAAAAFFCFLKTRGKTLETDEQLKQPTGSQVGLTCAARVGWHSVSCYSIWVTKPFLRSWSSNHLRTLLWSNCSLLSRDSWPLPPLLPAEPLNPGAPCNGGQVGSLVLTWGKPVRGKSNCSTSSSPRSCILAPDKAGPCMM